MSRMPLGPATGNPVVCGDSGVEGREAAAQLSGVETLKGLFFELTGADDVLYGGRFRSEYGQGDGGIKKMSLSDSLGE